MLRLVALVITDVSEELNTSIIKVTRIGELRTALAVTHNRRTFRRNTYFVFLRSVRRLLTLLTKKQTFRWPSSGMLRRVDLVRTDVWGEGKASIIRVTRIGELAKVDC
jgi:hypothetical protein